MNGGRSALARDASTPSEEHRAQARSYRIAIRHDEGSYSEDCCFCAALSSR